MNLIYRSVAYNNRLTTTEAQSSTKTNIQEQARYRILRKEKAVNNLRASMLFRTAHEVGLA